MSMTQVSLLETDLEQLECHFTWELKKEDTDITDVLNRLEQNIELNIGGKAGVAQTHNTLAFVKYILGSFTEALSNLQKSVELTREHHESNCDKWLIVSYGNLAWLQYHMKSYTECESYLQKLRVIAEKFPPPSASALHHEVLGEKAWTLYKFSRKYYKRAEECFREALALEPMFPRWNTGYAFVLHRDTESMSSSDDSAIIKQLRKAIDTNPSNDELKAVLALRLSMVQEYDEAENLVEKALEGSPTAPNVIRYVAKLLRTYDSTDRPVALLKRALESLPNSGFIHHQLALCYKWRKISLQRNGSPDSPGVEAEIQRLRQKCIYHLEKATTLKVFTTAMVELGVQYGEDNKLDRAEDQFQQSLQMAKERNECLQQVYFHFGVFQQYRKRCLTPAISYYKECLKINHKSMDGKRSAGKLLKIANRYLSKSPQDGQAWGLLGFVHKEIGENSRAIECYEKALQFKHNDEYLSALCELRLSLE
ncbi:interferon-induced protein with tetratricopeptide repeats 5-like [Hoplias malabaricus]|uniref:interferon-induced protein with tetratricopeptide repeats 5-like n=1 Tax=Hoplias malabaricus TaxID=27720 RepID=UPI00346333BE